MASPTKVKVASYSCQLWMRILANVEECTKANSQNHGVCVGFLVLAEAGVPSEETLSQAKHKPSYRFHHHIASRMQGTARMALLLQDYHNLTRVHS